MVDFKLYPTADEALANGIKDTDNTYCYAKVYVGVRNTEDKPPQFINYYINFSPTTYHSVCDDEELSEWVEDHWDNYCRASNLDNSLHFLADDIIVYKEPTFHEVQDAVQYLANWYRTKVSLKRYKQFLYFVSASTDLDDSDKPSTLLRDQFQSTLDRIVVP